MSAPSELENYSINEIMERLKSRPADKSIDQGELVTRADDTQAIRVHRKKRRSHQPTKKNANPNSGSACSKSPGP